MGAVCDTALFSLLMNPPLWVSLWVFVTQNHNLMKAQNLHQFSGKLSVKNNHLKTFSLPACLQMKLGALQHLQTQCYNSMGASEFILTISAEKVHYYWSSQCALCMLIFMQQLNRDDIFNKQRIEVPCSLLAII